MAIIHEKTDGLVNTDRVFGSIRKVGNLISPPGDCQVEQVKIICYRIGSPGIIDLGLYNVDVDGIPTGAALASTTFNGDSITTDTTGEWVTWALGAPLSRTSGDLFCILVEAPAGDISNQLRVLTDNADAGVSNGRISWTDPDWTVFGGQVAMGCVVLGVMDNADTEMVAAANDTGGTRTTTLGDTAWAAQTFTLTDNITLNRIEIPLRYDTAAPTAGDVVVEIYATSGGAPDTWGKSPIASGSIDAATANLTTSTQPYKWKSFSLSNCNLASGTEYAIVVRGDNISPSGRLLRTLVHQNNPVLGSGYDSADLGETWTPLIGTGDCEYRMYGWVTPPDFSSDPEGGNNRRIACLGDSSNHGGSIITTNTDGTVRASGTAVAVHGALHSCPIPNHGVTLISSIIIKTYANSKLVLTKDALAGCGAKITPQNRQVYVE